MTVACIITRYNETIDWIEYIQSNIDIFYIYNKGPNENFFKNPVSDVIQKKLNFFKIPNIGRIDHTIVYHILNKWDSLEQTNIFVPASILMSKVKGWELVYP